MVIIGIVFNGYQGTAQAQTYVTNTGQLHTATTNDDDSEPQYDKTGRPVQHEESGGQLSDGATAGIILAGFAALGSAGAYLYNRRAKVQQEQHLREQSAQKNYS